MIGTMQVTVKAPSSAGFILSDLRTSIETVEWDKGTIVRNPDGASDHDYISIALKSMGTRDISFEAGKEVKLFTFRNAASTSDVNIQLIDNNKDPLVKFSRNKYNVGNHISVFGYGGINAYTGNSMAVSSQEYTSHLRVTKVFPNPTTDKAIVSWQNLLQTNRQEIVLVVTNAATGRDLSMQAVTNEIGEQSRELSFGDQLPGVYFIDLQVDGIRSGKAIKLLVAH